MLNSYLASVQRLLHAETDPFWSTVDLTADINAARNQVALESECVRVLPTGNNTVAGQEIYSFSSVNPLVAVTPGVLSLLSVKQISISWGSLKPTLRQRPWSEFQAYFRAYQGLIQSYPTDFAQYGQGGNGSVYLFPIPSMVTSMDWDCVCLPISLALDTDPEAIAYPWTDAVPFYAAFLALLNAQRPEQAQLMYGQYERFMKRATAFTNQSFIPDAYGD